MGFRMDDLRNQWFSPTLLALERKGMIERKPYQDHTRIALWFEKKVDQTSQSS